ncbi:hypothetical protein [Halorubrum sp. AJ67]|uniref:hypothetical protein n=1 Tax=Halorubrum sp. AJ67 TaxID=1173487 RepID=UPI00064FCD1D|nr:hypothetical protein [Halorubrum sp. AJ67]
MSEQEIDEVEQLRRLGIGFALGGTAFGGLSFVTNASVSGVTLIVAGLLVWGVEHRRKRTVGIGLGIGFTGVVGMVSAAVDAGFDPIPLAATLVGFGIADYLLAPAYAKLRGAGEEASEADR